MPTITDGAVSTFATVWRRVAAEFVEWPTVFGTRPLSSVDGGPATEPSERRAGGR